MVTQEGSENMQRVLKGGMWEQTLRETRGKDWSDSPVCFPLLNVVSFYPAADSQLVNSTITT